MGDMTMPQVVIAPEADAAPLGWMIGEIRTTAEAAVAAVRRFLARSADGDALREAREQLHQAAGAVRMLDLRGAARMLDATERLVKHWEASPGECTDDGARTLEEALRALVAYLEGLRAGRADQPIRLFSHYRELQQASNAPRAHPADLLFPDLTRRPPLRALGVLPMTADQLRVRRARFEGALLRFLRDSSNPEARRDMRDALLDLEKLPQRGLARTFWWVVRGLLDALEADAVPVDVGLKRVLARVNLQLRRLIEGGTEVAERLLVDALYYTSRADARVSRIAEVRNLFDLGALLPADYERSNLVLLDADRIRALKQRLAEAKSAWNEAAAGADPAPFFRHLAAARDGAAALELSSFDALLNEVGQVAAEVPEAPLSLREPLAIEIATALLLVDLGVDDLPNLDEGFDGRARAMIERLRLARRGEAPATVEPWLSELARKAQDRLTMQTVIAELTGLLREVEQPLDRFFRDPAERGELGALVGSLEQMASVMSLLGFDDAVAALEDARATVARYAEPAAPADAADFARLAGNLGAVGFFIGTLHSEGDAARRRFGWDPAAAVFHADLATSHAAPGLDDEHDEYPLYGGGGDAEVAEDNVETAARGHLEKARELAARLAAAASADLDGAHALLEAAQQLANDADLLDDAAMKSMAREAIALARQYLEQPGAELAARLVQTVGPTTTAAPATPAPAAALPASQAAVDEELLGIFVEEAAEVLAAIEQQLEALRAKPGDQALLTTVRRGFHTLKGSSRMVGLAQFGEGAWAVEQTFNAWLSQERAATADLIALAAAARAILADWLQRVRSDPASAIDSRPLAEAAQRVREGQPFAIDAALLPPAEKAVVPPAADFDILQAIDSLSIPAEAVAPEAPSGAAVEPPPVGQPQAEAPRVEPEDAEALLAGILDDAASASDATAMAETGAAREELRRIGPLAISHALYNIFLGEADDTLRALARDVAEWRFEPARPASAEGLRSAHSLAGITATVGLQTVWALADPLDDLLHELQSPTADGQPVLDAPQFDLVESTLERIRGMLHQFAAGIYPPPAVEEVAAIRALVDELRERRARTGEASAPSASAGADSLASDAAAVDGQETLAAPEAMDQAVSQPVADRIDEAIAAFAAATTPEIDASPLASAADEAAQPVGRPERGHVAERPAEQAEAAAARAAAAAQGGEPVKEATAQPALVVADDLDADLLPVFLAEAAELLPLAGSRLRAIATQPGEPAPLRELMRLLHTVKGSARMAGAMRLGELMHDMESRVEAAIGLPELPPDFADDLLARYDIAVTLFEGLQQGKSVEVPALPARAAAEAAAPAAQPAAPVLRPVATEAAEEAAEAAAQSFVRVRADVLDRLVDQAGEVLIARSRVENHTATVRAALADLHDNIQRLRSQMRELAIQAEAQIQARSEKLEQEAASFDPLEFDRFTRLQELTRMIAESVEDVATIQSSMLKGLQTSEADLSAQYRLTRELQQQLMRVRLVPFASIAERIYRVARQAAKEVGKRINVDIRGGKTELDRVVLERMVGPLEHMVRNAIVHGLEPPAVRRAAGKPETGELRLEVRQEGNEIVIVVADDGAGLDLQRIRAKALAAGILRADQQPTDRELMDLVFAPGLSTAETVTELAGRGVGLDVVRSEMLAFGGRIAIASEAGRGTRFTLNLPLTLTVTQVVLASVGGRRYAIPAGMVEHVRRLLPEDAAEAIAEGTIDLPEAGLVTLRTLAQLVGEDMTLREGRQVPVLLLRSGEDRMAVIADEVSTNQEVVVKNVGPQVARLAGILGATILGNGEIVLIVNPVQLIVRAPEPPQLTHRAGAVPQSPAPAAPDHEAAVTLAAAPLVMVVDDSLTVRRVTQRLLERSGYEVLLAKDGVEAVRQLQDVRPDVMLVDIEMPRMDGFDLTRHVRGNELTRSIPIVMITSRTADKHRRMALELGVNAYLGKPYQDDELLALLRTYLGERAVA